MAPLTQYAPQGDEAHTQLPVTPEPLVQLLNHTVRATGVPVAPVATRYTLYKGWAQSMLSVADVPDVDTAAAELMYDCIERTAEI